MAIHHPRTRGQVAAAALMIVCGTHINAHAHSQHPDRDFDRAVRAAGKPAARVNSDLVQPRNGSEPVKFDAGESSVSLRLPARGAREKVDSTSVFAATSGRDEVAVEPAGEGFRTMVRIAGPESPEQFSFTFGGDIASLKLQSDGSVATLDADGRLIGVVDTPWARDAHGKAVPTSFSVNGTTLTQTVDHRGENYAYGVIADPWWNPFSWPWGTWVKKSKKAVGKALKKCGVGAAKTVTALAVGTGTTNVLIDKLGNGRAFLNVGGWQGYVGVAAAGCVAENL